MYLNIKKKFAQESFIFFIFIFCYFLFEACFVSFISLGAGLDDAELISNISFWNWGYGGSQPPLYTWLAYGLTSVFGLHFLLLQLLRFTLLASVFYAVYAGLRLLRVQENAAVFACLSIFLLPQITWESQRALIHSVLGLAGSAWFFAAFAWFARRSNYKRALLLGLTVAAAVLGKYNALLFIIALLTAASLFPFGRRAMGGRHFIAALFFAALLMLPALLFMALHPHGVVERAAKFQMWGSGYWLYDRGVGLLDLALAGFNFLLPALSAFAFIAAFTIQKQKKCLGSEQASEERQCEKQRKMQRAMRFLFLILLCGLILCAIMVLFSGATRIKDRWLQPVLFLAPVYMTLFLAHLDSTGRAMRVFGFLGVACALCVPPILYANLYARSGAGKLPIQNLDYPALYNELESNGKIATMLAPDPFYVGNIRLLNPQIKTLFAETPFAAERLQRPLVILWKNDAQIPVKLLPIMRQAAINMQDLPPVRLTAIAYRGQKMGKQSGQDIKNEQIYYLYLP